MGELARPEQSGLPNDETGELRRFAQRVRETEARRRELVANAGHELKTPLSIILGLSGRLLAGAEVAPPQRRDLERIRANAHGLLKHVEDLLEAARIHGGSAVLRPAPCDVAALVRDAAGGFSSLLDELGARLVLHAPGRLPAHVDEVKLGTVLTNLLANAVRYVPRGGVVRCTLAIDDGRLRIEVADSGPGVPEGEREAIFERFRQLEDPAHRRPGGTGLGLAIVRDLVVLHGGSVVAGEAPEGGALFTVELPHDPAVATPAAVPPILGPDIAERERATVEALGAELRAAERRRSASAGPAPARDLPRVLLVETSAVLSLYLEELLDEDYDVLHAATAAEAVRIAHGGPIDAALVDVGGHGGEALLGALRGPGLDGVPIVVLATDPEHARDLVRERADDYAVQPFAADELLVRLGSLVGRRRAESARAQADARFQAVFEQVPTAMALASEDGRVLEANAALERLLGVSAEGLRGLTLDDLSHPDDLLAGDRATDAPGDGDVARVERRLVAADGRVVPTLLTVSSIREEGAPRQLVLQVEEAPGRRRPDPGSPALQRAVSAQLARCLRYDERAALLLVEIDDLDAAALDDAARLRALATVARTVRRRLRRSDVLVRAGERRFAALVVNAGAHEAIAVARSVQNALAGTPAAGDHPLPATVAVCAFDHTATAGRIVAEAEAALLAARRDGGVAATGA